MYFLCCLQHCFFITNEIQGVKHPNNQHYRAIGNVEDCYILNSRVDRVVTAYTIQGNSRQYNSGNGWLGLFCSRRTSYSLLFFAELDSYYFCIWLLWLGIYCIFLSYLMRKEKLDKVYKNRLLYNFFCWFQAKINKKSTTIPFLSLSGHVLKDYNHLVLDWMCVNIEISLLITGHSWRARSTRAKDPL